MVRRPKSNVKELAILSSLAGLLYCSWPLGYILNPSSSRSLASNLQGSGQPYNWLFILLDILCGLVIIYVAFALYKMIHFQKWLSLKIITIISYGTFGLLTVVDALLPVDCAADQNSCGALVNHPMVIIHGVFSIVSIGALAISVLGGWLIVRSSKQWSRWLKPYTTFVVGSYFFFGVVTCLLILTGQSSSLSQHVFIVICSFWIATIPLIVLSGSEKNRYQKVRVAKSP